MATELTGRLYGRQYGDCRPGLRQLLAPLPPWADALNHLEAVAPKFISYVELRSKAQRQVLMDLPVEYSAQDAKGELYDLLPGLNAGISGGSGN